MSYTKDKKLFHKIKTILYYTIIFILSMYIIFEVFIPDQTVKVFGFKPYNVMTQSMEPVLNVNDMIIVKNFKVEELEVDDIITFYSDIDYNGEEEIITHYIYSIIEDAPGEFTIRTNRYYSEDQTPVADTWRLDENDVLGLYSFKIPYLGYVTEFLKSPFGIAAIVVNAGIIITIVYMIKRDKREKLKSNEEGKQDSN